ncbi:MULTISPECIES: hypothetical protein [unclassified Nocardiopsis]|uniref:hypothetical protein n=1 Tax=unclassified Nocardiopsis TaxID=2649073 RepID=UPI0033EECCF7
MSHPRTPARALSLTAAALVAPLLLTACSGDRERIDAACLDIDRDMNAVDLAAQGIDQDILVDDIPYQDQHRAVLEDHLDVVLELEDAARGDLRDVAAERADAVDSVLVELDEGDYDTLADALNFEADTQSMILEACGY